MKFVDYLPSVRFGNNSSKYVGPEIQEELKNNPGKWGVIGEFDKDSPTPTSICSYWNKQLRGYGFHFKFRTDSERNVRIVYGCYQPK